MYREDGPLAVPVSLYLFLSFVSRPPGTPCVCSYAQLKACTSLLGLPEQSTTAR